MRRLRLAALLAANLACTACVVGPVYRTPAIAPVVPGGSLNAVAEAMTPDPAPAAWWTTVGDPVLDDLVRRALADSPDLRQAVGRVRAARALFQDRRLDALPRVTSDAGYARSREQRPGFTTDATTITQADIGFDASWEIDLFGHVRHSVDAARAEAEASRFDLRDAQVTVAAEVARNYFILRGAQARQAVAQENARAQAETLRLTEVRLNIGQGDPVDVQSARARLESTLATIPALAITAAQAADRLAVLLGQRPGALDVQLAVSGAPSLPAIKPLAVGDVSSFLRRRPDVRAAERRLAAETAAVGVANADLFPRVRIEGFVGLLSGDPAALFKSAAGAWSIAPTVTWPALDLGGARARLRQARANADVSLAAYDKVVLAAVEDLQNALVAYGQHGLQIRHLAAQVDASRRAAELAQIRYREGAIDFLRVLDAERTRLDAEDALTRAQVDANVDMVAVYKALGGV
jgi:multidrug efflux system outer membrane protein